MERLSGLDASFLYLESPEQLMHVCAVLVLDTSTLSEGYDFVSLRDKIATRVAGLPMFNRKLRRVPLGLDHPVWVTDKHFDIERHVHRLAVPAPGGEKELTEVVGHLAGLPLDRSRPLWEMWVLEGLADGHIVMLLKAHHATVDGVSGANLIAHLCSLAPEAEPVEPVPAEEVPERTPSYRELAARGAAATAARPFSLVKMIAPTARIAAGAFARARRGEAMAAPLLAPRTSFNGNITGHRSIALAEFDLDDVRAVKNAVPGATVNDVVLTVTGGALRRYLNDRDELPEASLMAVVPVSVHGESRHERGTNKISTMFTRLGTDIEDPVDRLAQLSVTNSNAKEHHRAIPADTLQDWAKFAAPRTFALGVRMVSGMRLAEGGPVIHNLIVSNVPGPPVPLYFLGARIEGLYPLGPIFHGAGLNVTVMSLSGRMYVGIIGCRESVPRPGALAESFPKELEELKTAVLG
ncbi:diacylglycerol O-acyltransferase [Nocardioides albertanoniae]|uniref:Diacylglycerol O-acyltransferase n=1 Tax=Nocardioides albertanoniae TaxID=1175486 RepID=A0A543A767_9ACTN|nr:wax ester/triacylglycerol synthase family O-acyltransferase [Nocardioides albertanoniae]TQL68452.1 diacylglycerol O-acyltransferase [Nocardioides albertanoniae]